eukprot:3994490-Ditylum_brightwellii.AAC.1
MDPRFPEPMFEDFDAHAFCDADHGHDQITGRSITGLFTIVYLTSMTWSSKRQKCVHTLTLGAEFTALKAAVEKAVMLHYHLRSMGIK